MCDKVKRAADIRPGEIIHDVGVPYILMWNLLGAAAGTRFLMWGARAGQSRASPDNELIVVSAFPALPHMERVESAS